MELKYQATYRAKGLKAYSVGEIQGVTPALELAEPRLRAAEGKLEPGEICMLIFGVTAEEYAWRENDTKKLDALAEQLRKRVPADRLIAWRVVDLKGKPVQREIKPQTGESIDGGAYAQAMKSRAAQAAPVSAGSLDDCLKECCRLQKLCAAKDAPEGVRADWSAAKKRLGAELMQCKSLWVAFDAPTGGRLPFAGYDGRMEIFTAAERAENAQKRIAATCGGEDFWQLKEIPANEMEKFLHLCSENGLTALRVDNGFAPAELSLEELIDCGPAENAALRSLLLREAEYGLRWNRYKAAQVEEKLQRGALESMLTLRNFAWRTLGNSILYALCAMPGGEGEFATSAAAAKLGTGLRVVPGDKCVLLNEKQSGASRFPVFTSKKRALALCARVRGAQPVRMTFDDLAQRVGAAEGILIDPDDLGYRLPKAEFDKVRELRAKPPMAVRVKPAEEAPVPTPAAPAPRLQPEMGELPDPDSFDLPPKTQDVSAAEAPEAGAPEEKQERKPGFFRRFMKK